MNYKRSKKNHEDIESFKKRLDSELRSKRLQKLDFSETKKFKFNNSRNTIYDDALVDISLAEVSTTVRSSLPKFFNRLLRKQNKVNRYLISAVRNILRLQNETESENRAKWSDFTRSLSNLYSRVNSLVDNQNASPGSSEEFLEHARHADFSQFYLAFENEFRGSHEEISERLKVHLPVAIEARERTIKDPFEALDLGCGRGEWLSLLLGEGIIVRGIDTNPSLLKECKSKNLLVEEGDAISKLINQPDQSLSLISAFHLIEHLDFQAQFLFIRSAFRALRTGGILLIETPNVQNIDVGASGFYHDPTHIRPLTWTLAKFIAEYVGFLPVEIKFLNPDPSFANVDIQVQEIDSRLHGPRDYALIGYKP